MELANPSANVSSTELFPIAASPSTSVHAPLKSASSVHRLMTLREQGLSEAFRKDKSAILARSPKHAAPPPDTDCNAETGVVVEIDEDSVFKALDTVVRDTVAVEHKGDWFDATFLKLHTTPLLHEITEAMYQVSLFRKDNAIRHTGLRFHSPAANTSFVFDVQSFGVDRSYTPVFRVEPEKPFKYHFIGHVFLSKGLLSLLSQIKSQKYGATHNCRDGFMATIVICQFWNASIGIPNALDIEKVLEFMAETIQKDRKYITRLCCGYSNKAAEARRREVESLTKQLAVQSGYDATIALMRKLDIIEDESVPPLFVVQQQFVSAQPDPGQALPAEDAGQELPDS